MLGTGCKNRKTNATYLDSTSVNTQINRRLIRIDSITVTDLDGNLHTTITKHYVTDSSK